MPYSASMGRDKPGLFIFVLDQSGSMGDPWPRNSQAVKAEALADILNNTLSEIAARCVKNEGQVSNRCSVVVLGYGGSTASSAWKGTLSGKLDIPIADVSANPLNVKMIPVKMDNGAGGIVEQDQPLPVWIEPVNGGGTPMKEALSQVCDIVDRWLPAHPDCFPPVVIHITDGEPTSGSPLPEGERLKKMVTKDGNLLMVTVYLSSTSKMSVLFPNDTSDLPANDVAANLLFNMSSVIPADLVPRAKQTGLDVSDNSRLMVLNADAVEVIKLIQFATIGTMGAQDR